MKLGTASLAFILATPGWIIAQDQEKDPSYVNREQPPASTLVIVKQLLRPKLLIEVDAIAVTKD